MSPSTTPTPSTTLDQALADLPAKLRVHELAKRAGLTSKEIIAALASAGVPVSSAASSVSSADAVVVLTALFPAAADAAVDPVVDPSPSQVTGEATAPTGPETDPGFFAAPLFLPPAEAKPARRKRAPKVVEAPEPVLDETGRDASAGADTAVDAASDGSAAPLTEQGDPTQQTDQDGNAMRSGRRRRGRSGGRGRAEQSDGPAEETVTPLPDAPTAAPEIDLTTEGVESADGTDLAAGTDLAGGPEDEDESDQARRRRRRGRRGRGRAGDERPDQADTDQPTADSRTGQQDAGDGESTESDDAEDQTDEQAGDDEQGSDGATRRRRRRRRRTGSAEGSSDENNREDDPDNTVVHVREPRTTAATSQPSSSASEVQGVRGSTRLEAKRQRRRDSRGTRSRPQILTEAEFLARREAVDRVMAVRQRGDLAQVALLEDGVLVEHFVSRAGSESLMGNIYLGRVQNVLPSMEAAFVDIGKGRNAVLYAGEVNWDAAGLAGKARRIETALSGGDTVLVQVSKDPVGHKGARLTTQISLPGRFLVYVPGGGATGISRKLPDTERKRLKSILDRIVPSDAGVIIRTAAEGVDEEELARDVERLKTQWEEISRQADKKSNAPLQLSAEPDTLIKVIRDLFNSDISRLVLDGDRAYEPVAAYIDAVAPELSDRVSRYDGPNDVFAAYRIDEQIAKALERKVYLPSGGSLVIDRTEAMTVVDVNTGKYTGSGGNLEETVTKNNLEAAEEVVRQLRLRDIGGIIVVDFIDMVLESNRELVMRRLTECLGRDRTRHQVAEVTSLGLIQMTRKKMGTGLVEAFSEPCPHCQGRGIILHDVPMEDRSGNQDSGDDDRRSARGRRGKNRADAAPIESIAKIVPATVRPPDPRGPKPPTRGAEEDHGAQQTDVQRDQNDTGAPEFAASVRFDTDPIFDPVGAVETPTDDAAFNAPKSRDASDAVSAVLAALDAQQAARSTDNSTQQGQTTAPTGRRRGRRAAGRPAGAPTAVSTEVLSVSVPATDTNADADTNADTEFNADTDFGVTQVAAEPVTTDLVAAPADQSLMAETTTPASVVDPVGEAEPVRRGRAPRRRGARAAGAPGVAAEPSATPPQELTAPATAAVPVPGAAAVPVTAPDVVESTRSAETESNGSVAVAPGSVDDPATPKKAAPRRRRAASRPAGPASAPAPIVGG